MVSRSREVKTPVFLVPLYWVKLPHAIVRIFGISKNRYDITERIIYAAALALPGFNALVDMSPISLVSGVGYFHMVRKQRRKTRIHAV